MGVKALGTQESPNEGLTKTRVQGAGISFPCLGSLSCSQETVQWPRSPAALLTERTEPVPRALEFVGPLTCFAQCMQRWGGGGERWVNSEPRSPESDSFHSLAFI